MTFSDGNAGHNVTRSPGLRVLDFWLKKFPPSQQAKFQFLGEFFNLTTAGVISSVYDSRGIRLDLRVA